MFAVPSLPAGLGALVAAAALVGLVGVTVAGASDARKVVMRDDCDPATFNAAIGPGTCVGGGDTTFDEFLAQVGKDHKAGAWRFSPDKVEIKSGTQLAVVNRGGETHTFTCVSRFGGGIVPILNQLSGNTTVAPECQALDDDDFVPPGGSYPDKPSHAGVEKYQCCIHPWMRATVRVR